MCAHKLLLDPVNWNLFFFWSSELKSLSELYLRVKSECALEIWAAYGIKTGLGIGCGMGVGCPHPWIGWTVLGVVACFGKVAAIGCWIHLAVCMSCGVLGLLGGVLGLLGGVLGAIFPRSGVRFDSSLMVFWAKGLQSPPMMVLVLGLAAPQSFGSPSGWLIHLWMLYLWPFGPLAPWPFGHVASKSPHLWLVLGLVLV